MSLLNSAQVDCLNDCRRRRRFVIVAGERMAAGKTNYQDASWMPAKLVGVASSKNGVQPAVRSFQHSALELFHTAGEGAMRDTRFPKWAKVDLAAKATVMAAFNNGDPLLIEKTFKKGRVVLCTVPPDRRWNSTFPSEWEFPVLLHELAYYLAGGQASAPPVAPDLRESDLTRCTPEDWRKVRERLSACGATRMRQSWQQMNRSVRSYGGYCSVASSLLCSEV